MEGYRYLFVILFMLVILPAALYLVLKPMFRDIKVRRGIVNYDTHMRKFVFTVEETKAEVYLKLRLSNIYDVLRYDFDEENAVITFYRNHAKFPYRISFYELDGTMILKIEQISPTMDKDNLPYFINEFFIKKLDAKPIDLFSGRFLEGYRIQ